MTNSDFPRLREFERLDQQVQALDQKLDALTLTVVRLEEALTAHAGRDSRNLKIISSILVVVAGALGGSAPKIIEMLAGLFQ
jgi:hypothetical protein